MKKVLFVGALLFAVVGTAAAQDANQEKLEKECVSLFAKGGPCEGVPKGELRACVAKPANLKKASPSCRAVVSKLKGVPKL
jgi:hypothetical protein